MGWPYITLAWCISILSLGIAPLVVTLLCRQSILNYYGYFTTKTVAALKRDESNPKSPTAGVASDVSAAPPKKEGAKAQPPITTETIGDERLYIQDAIAARHIAAARRAIDTLYGKVDQLETEMFNKLDLKDVPPDLELVWYINRLCVALRFSLVSILMRSRAAIDATLDLLSALELFAETAIHDIPNSWRESNLGELAKKYYEANQ
jgi:hypothetical protein